MNCYIQFISLSYYQVEVLVIGGSGGDGKINFEKLFIKKWTALFGQPFKLICTLYMWLIFQRQVLSVLSLLWCCLSRIWRVSSGHRTALSSSSLARSSVAAANSSTASPALPSTSADVKAGKRGDKWRRGRVPYRNTLGDSTLYTEFGSQYSLMTSQSFSICSLFQETFYFSIREQERSESDPTGGHYLRLSGWTWSRSVRGQHPLSSL